MTTPVDAFGVPTDNDVIRSVRQGVFGSAMPAWEGLLSDADIAALKGKLSHEKGVKDPGALAASIGRKKLGKKAFDKKAAAGRKK